MPSPSGGGIIARGDNMQITIGRTSDDRRKLQKSFSGSDITAQLKQPCDVLNPVFIISYNSNYITSNYVHVPEFGRYYFINNINLLPGNRAELSCSVDVLMSWQSEINSVKTLISRQENAGLSTIPDSNIVIKNYDIINIYASDMSFDTAFGNYVLELYGG